MTHEERRHAERERLTFTQFSVDHAAEAMFWLDAEGRFVNANPATLTLTGYAREELPALRVWTVDLDTDAGAWPEVWASVRADGRVVAHAPLPDAATAPRSTWRSRTTSWTTADGSGSARSRATSAIAGAPRPSARSIWRASASCAWTRRAPITLKDEFLATLSHELRTPLTAIVGWARMLRAGRLDEEARARLATIERNAQVQSQLVNDLLDVSRIVVGKLRWTCVPSICSR